MSVRTLGVPLVAFQLILAGCKPAPAPTTNVKAGFRGARVRVLVPDRPELHTWLNDHRGEWSAETGGEVEVVTFQLAEPARSSDVPDAGTAASMLPAGDILIYATTTMGNVVDSGQLAKVPKDVLDRPDYDRKDFGPLVNEHLISWDRQTYALPLSVECPLVFYRKDLFEGETHRERFREKFGRTLRPPATWDEFDDIVGFFDGMDLDGDGTPDHSLVVGDAGEALVCRAAAYGKPPQNLSFYFDIGTTEPLLTGPPFQEAMEKWCRLAQCLAGEPGEKSILSHFASRRTALALGSSLLASQLFASSSSHGQREPVNNLDCVAVPASGRVYLHDKQTWMDLPREKPNRTIVAGGLVASVLKSSKYQDAAFDFLAFLTNRERSLASVTSVEYRLGPYRQSHVVDPAAWIAAGWSTSATPSFLSAMRDSLGESNVVTVLRIHGSEEYQSSLDAQVLAALRGDVPAPDALSRAAESWRAITERRDQVRQRRQYRYSLGMPVLN